MSPPFSVKRMITLTSIKFDSIYGCFFGGVIVEDIPFSVQFVMETWRIMGEKDVCIDDKCYLLIIRALCKGGYLEEVRPSSTYSECIFVINY